MKIGFSARSFLVAALVVGLSMAGCSHDQSRVQPTGVDAPGLADDGSSDSTLSTPTDTTNGVKLPDGDDLAEAAVADSTPARGVETSSAAGQDSDELIDHGTFFEWRVPSRPARMFSFSLSQAGYLPGDAIGAEIRVDCNGYESHYDTVVRVQTRSGATSLGPGPQTFGFRMISNSDILQVGFSASEPVCKYRATHGNYIAHVRITKRLPNLKISGLVRTNPGGISFDYRLEGRIREAQTVRAYWLMSNGDIREFNSWQIEPTTTSARLDVSGAELTRRFVEGARSVLVIADPDSKTNEKSETDNRAELPLPNYAVKGLKWDDKGGLEFQVEVKGSRTPYNLNPTVQVRWLYRAGSLPAHDEVFEASSRVLFEARIPKEAGTHRFRAALRDLRKFNLESRTHVVVVIDFDRSSPFGLSIESDESTGSNYGYLDLSANRISFELDETAPYANSGKRRIELWVIENKAIISKAATVRHVDKRAIAGAILWEAIENPKRHLSRGYGAGKTHWDTAIYVENQGYMPRISDAARQAALESPGGAISYLAGIMNAYATEAEKVTPPFKIRGNAGILAAYFNGAKSLQEVIEGHYFLTLRQSGGVPRLPNAGMGPWVHNHLSYITKLLNEKI